MNAFDTGITGALALFAPRRMGKTEFLLLDLALEAEGRNYQVGYCSFWNLQENPAKALRITLDGIKKVGPWREKWLSYAQATTSELSAGFGNTNIKLRTQPKSQVIQDDLLAIIDGMGKLARKRQPTLLLLDEVQHLADERYGPFVATLRTQFDEHRQKIKVVFTGSSRDGLQRMFRDRKAPMFHAAQQVDFPDLDAKFVVFMLKAFEQASKRKLAVAPATRIFKQLGNNPSLFHHLLRHMVIKGLWDIEQGYDNFRALIDVEADYRLQWQNLKPIDHATLAFLAQQPDSGVYGEAARDAIGEEMGVGQVSVKAVQNALDRLREAQIIYSPNRGEWVFEDPEFAHWVCEQA